MTSELELNQFALRIRVGIVEAIAAKGGGHIGGSLDLAELLSVLYRDFMRVRPAEPDWDGRDYLICSKGHAGPALYATLALKGFFPYELLRTLNQENTTLPGHCDRTKVPGIDATTGSLGQGLSIACGTALGFRLSETAQRVFCILGDGELAEGQNWEAAAFAAHHGLDNLVAFLDWNKMQIDGSNDAVMTLGDPVAKLRAFGWNASVVNGGDVLAIQKAVEAAVTEKNGAPTMIVLDTVKGAGVTCVSQMANNHCIGFPGALLEQAMEELIARGRALGMEVRKCL
ncbi:transketolase [Oscillibacter sp.]|uniref:transketolase n=1 Tax=Oscillibacter sp. TaxID=1945593 RepID=UPI0028997685|nr:transketolase [Oscillibacter sp.]